MKRDAVIFDIDGVLANNDHRVHHLTPPDPDWNAFFEACGFDDVYQDAWNLVRLLRQNYAIVLITGRPEWVRPHTVDWLDKKVIQFTQMVMRPDSYSIPGDVFKSLIVDELRSDFEFKMAFEDNTQTVQMYRDRGIPCWQPREESKLMRIKS